MRNVGAIILLFILILFALLFFFGCVTDGDFGVVEVRHEEKICEHRHYDSDLQKDSVAVDSTECDGPLEVRWK